MELGNGIHDCIELPEFLGDYELRHEATFPDFRDGPFRTDRGSGSLRNQLCRLQDCGPRVSAPGLGECADHHCFGRDVRLRATVGAQTPGVGP